MAARARAGVKEQRLATWHYQFRQQLPAKIGGGRRESGKQKRNKPCPAFPCFLECFAFFPLRGIPYLFKCFSLLFKGL